MASSTQPQIYDFKGLCLQTDFVQLYEHKVQLSVIQSQLIAQTEKDNIGSISAIEGVLNFLDAVQDLAREIDFIPEEYIHPEEDRVLVCWPESQVYMDHPDFDEEASLINDEYGLHRYGSSAYWIPIHIIEEIDGEYSGKYNRLHL